MSDLSTVPARRQWKGAVKSVLVFVLVGPPVGAVLEVILTMLIGPSQAYTPGFFLLAVMFGIALSYILGGVQALATGILVAAYGLVKGRPPIWVALLSALCAFVALGRMEYLIVQSVAPEYLPRVDWGLQLPLSWPSVARLSTYLIPAYVCWYISKRFWLVSR